MALRLASEKIFPKFPNLKMESNSQCYSGLQFCTFNCRSVKNCIPELQKLCDINDIVFLQEHWLLPDELHLLNNIHLDFFSCGLSLSLIHI